MTSYRPIIRNAIIEDAAAMARVEQECWPAVLATNQEQIESRIGIYAAGQWVAVIGDDIVGTIFAQRISLQFFEETAKQYDALTDEGTFARSHDEQGEIYQMVGVSVVRAAKGLDLGRALVDQQIGHAHSCDVVERIIGFTRPAKYHEHSEIPIEEYVELRHDDGSRLDPVLSFHLDNGATFGGTFADYRPQDLQTCGYGVLIEYE